VSVNGRTGDREKLLLHCCCGPCAATVVQHFASAGKQVTGWYYNPNIYPPEEMRVRQQALQQASIALGMPLLPPGPEPDPADFLLAVAAEGGVRCRACYRLRLEAAARKAKEEGFPVFSTTLSISPYQDLEAIREIGEAAAAEHGVRFEFVDLREKHRESLARARSLGLYCQNYCGCLFSGLERSQRRAQRAVRKSKV